MGTVILTQFSLLVPTFSLPFAPPLLPVRLVSVLQRSPTNPFGFHCFGVELTPVHYRRRTARPVSCYALFKWWLLLSQHPGCRGNSTSLVTKTNFGTLADDQGCFPLVPGAYPPGTDSQDSHTGIRSLVQEGSLGGPPTRFSISTPGT